MRRRTLLASLGGLAGSTTIAGCLGGPIASTPTPTQKSTSTTTPAPTPTPTSSPTPEPTDSGDHPVPPTQTSFQVLGRPCGSGQNAASVTFAGDTVQVDGVIGGRDTCDTARLAKAELRGDVFTVAVEVTEEAHTETAACAQCLTDIEYAFEATFPNGVPGRVRVVHRSADGESVVTRADRP